MQALLDDIVDYSHVTARHKASLTRRHCGLLPCYCLDTMPALLDDIVVYSPVTDQAQC